MNLTKKKQQFATGLPIVNLLSPSVFEAIAVRRLRQRLVAAGIGLALLVGGGWAVQHLRAEQAAKLLVVEQGETVRLRADTQELAPVSQFVAEVAKQKSVVQQTMAKEAFVSRVLDDLSAATPTGVLIEKVGVTVEAPQAPGATAQPKQAGSASPCPAPNPFATQSQVGCVTLSGTAPNRAAVGRLVVQLGKGGVFAAPYISTTSTADGERVSFTGTVALSTRVYSNRYADIDALLATGGAR